MVLARSLQRLAVGVLLVAALGVFSGCVYLVIGSLGVVGGYVVSPDTVEGTTDHDFESAWNAASEVCNIMGRVYKENDKEGNLEALINGSRVTIKILELSRDRIRVKARRSFFPSISTAQDVYVKIINQLKG